MNGSSILIKTFHKSTRYLKHKSPTILTCIGAAGVIGTAVMTSKGTTKANLILEEARKEKGEALTKMEKLNIALPSYIPALMLGAATITCIFGANSLNKRNQAALLSAYGLLDNSYKEYKKKVDDYYGEGSNEEIEEEIAKDKYNENPIEINDDSRLFYDEYSKRYFTSTLFKVQQAVYHLNRDLTLRDYAYLNEFYESVELEPIESGYKLGWSVGACMDMYWQPWIDFGYTKTTMDDGQEYTIIRMLMEPIPDFEDYF